ncbi:MAG: hypothetical protein ACERK6_12275 [Candidatus Aminicenantaceae bacterium]
MKKIPYILVLIGVVAMMFLSAGCGDPNSMHVTVGVGVAYPGGWGGPYGGPYGGVYMGRPIYYSPVPFPLF